MLCALVVAAPLAIGGVHPTVQVALCALIALWASVELGFNRRGYRASPFLWPALVACSYTALQLLPLPGAVVRVLSPAAFLLRDQQGTHWMPLTLDVPATVLALMRMLGLTMILSVGGYVLRTGGRARAVMWTVAGLGAGLSVLTFGQRIYGSHTILGFYQPRSLPGSGVFGTFVSGNHCASVGALGALAAAGLALESEHGKRFFALVCAALSSILVLFTMSRAGAFGLGVGGFALATVLLSRRYGRATGVLSAIVLLGAATSAALWMSDGLRGRLADPTHTLTENQKTRGWRDAITLGDAYLVTGVGRGAFEAPMEAFRSDDEGVRLVYPENILLQRSTEWGVPIVLVLLVLIGLALRRAGPLLKSADAVALAAAAGVLAVVTHELADFGLEMMGVAVPTAVLLALVVARTFGRQGLLVELRPAASVGLLIALMTVSLGGAWAARHTLDADYRMAREAAAHGQSLPSILPELMARHPASGELALLAALDDLRRHDPATLRALNHALVLHPADWEAHALTGRALVELHRPAQAAIEYREAIEHGMTPNTAELYHLLGEHIVDAAPQRPKELEQLARDLVNAGVVPAADRASQRAVELSGGTAAARSARLELAIRTRRPALVRSAVDMLLDGTSGVDDYLCSVRALADVGDAVRADATLRTGQERHPDAEPLRLLAVQIHLERGDLTGARALLSTGPPAGAAVTLADRQHAEELSASIADRSGDIETAILARARARAIAHQRGLPDSAVK